jgi:outer membrane receptor for ferrienterochelin and colicin
MRSNRTWLVALVLPLLMATVLVAQMPTSTILGRVINEGQGLPGVTVTAKSPALQGVRTAVTSTNGDFVFPNLPPGRYTVSFTMSGFQTVTREINAAASQQAAINVEMSLSAVAAEAVVVGTSETISQTTTAATTYTAELTKKLPITRTLLSAVLLAPGVSSNGPGGNLTISGAQSFDNNMMVNGVNIQDNVRGTANNLFIEDAIAETTTSTSAISAEYGRFTGGVVNAITKSGGNTFSGSVRATLENDKWTAKTPLTTAEQNDKVTPIWEGTLGGPVLKDKIWFFLAGRYRNFEGTAQTFKTNIPYDTGNIEQRWEAKGTFTPFQNHTLTASYMNIQQAQVNRIFRKAYDTNSVFTPHMPQELFAANYNGVLTDKLFVEAQYSKRDYTFKDYGATTKDLYDGTAMLDWTQTASYNSPTFCGICDYEYRNNENYFVKATYFLSTEKMGSHNIVFGYDDYTGMMKSNNYQSGSNYTVYTPGVIQKGTEVFPVIIGGDSWTTDVVYWPILQQAEMTDLNTRSVFMNDTWRLNNNLSFNIGIRYDKNKGVDSRGFVGSDDDAFSPRLGVTWDIKGDGSLRVGASYARYVGGIQENYVGASSSAGSPAIYDYYYEGPDVNTGASEYGSPTNPYTTKQALEVFFRWFGITGTNQFPSAGKTIPDYISLPGVNTTIPESLKSSYTDEFSVNFSGNLGTRGNYRVDGVYREFGDFIASQTDLASGQIQDDLGNDYDMTWVVNNDALERKYIGASLQANYRLLDSLNIGGNYTWSHTYGNVVGETSGSGPVRSGIGSYPEYFDRDWSFPTGDLSQDQRHRIRVWATYDIPLPKVLGSLSLSPLWQFDSGTPYAATGTIDSRPYVTNPGYVSPTTGVTYYYTAMDAFRTDNISRLDLSLNYSYFIGPVEIFAQPQVINLLNQDNVVTPYTTVENLKTHPNSGGKKYYLAFNPFTTAPVEGKRPADGVNPTSNWYRGDNFGKANAPASYQTPRTFRVGFGVRF